MCLFYYKAVGKMRKIKCGMETVERCCGTVGKMRNVEICRMWAIVCPQGIVNSCGWACCTLVVRSNCIKSEFVIDVPQLICLKVQDLPISLLCRAA